MIEMLENVLQFLIVYDAKTLALFLHLVKLTVLRLILPASPN